MAKRIFSLRDRGYDTYEKQVAAVGYWVTRTLKNGAWPSEEWPRDARQKIEADANALALDPQALHLNWSDQGFSTIGHWTLTSGSWDKYFLSIIAATGTRAGLHGTEAREALGRVTTASTRVRVMTFKRRGEDGSLHRAAMAAVVDDDAIHLFDPQVGLSTVDITEAFFWFGRYMDSHYGLDSNILEWRTHVVRVSDLFYTWFGPPSPQRADGQQPDVMGPRMMARAQFASEFPPRVKFCCLSRYESQFRPLLPRNVEIVPVEELFPNQLGRNARLSQPDFHRLDLCVETILSVSTAPGSDIRALVNAKNVWSLFCLWKYGGYHLDTGVVPLPAGVGSVAFPKPTTFGMVDTTNNIGDPGDASFAPPTPVPVPHWSGSFGKSGLNCVAIRDDNSILETIVLKERGLKSLGSSLPLHIQFDVWLMRSPQADPAVLQALKFYIYLWFEIERERSGLSDLLYKSASRAAILSAVATGMTHPAPERNRCNALKALPAGSLMEVTNDLAAGHKAVIDELKVKKVGFRSHG